MLTICDADSLFAPRFLEMLEWTFRQQCNPEYAAPPSSRPPASGSGSAAECISPPRFPLPSG